MPELEILEVVQSLAIGNTAWEWLNGPPRLRCPVGIVTLTMGSTAPSVCCLIVPQTAVR